MAVVMSIRESMEKVSDPRSLDRSVEEVFHLMLGVNCVRDWDQSGTGPEAVTAVVGFGGVLSGACILRASTAAAMAMAALMTSMTFDEVDDTVKDAMGEVCNMLAGSWKGKLPELASHCGLSVPAVITGRDYRLHVQAPEFQIDHIYRFGEQRFSVTIVCDGMQ